MQNQLTEFADAVNGAACKIFTDYGEAVNALQQVALIAPPARPVAVGLSLAQMAAKQNCDWDTEQPGPTNPDKGGCWKMDGGGLVYSKDINGNFAGQIAGDCRFPETHFEEIISVQRSETRPPVITVRTVAGATTQVYADIGQVSFYLEPCPGSSCAEDDPSPAPPPPAPYTHVTEEGCELTVNFQGWGQLPDGSASGIFLVEPAPGARAGGGRIGGCNFAPTIVYNPGGGGGGGGGGGPFVVPYPPDSPGPDGKPLWQKLLEAALAGAVSGLVQNLFDETDKKLDQLLECACPEKPVQEGDYRTISFRSDETSPFSNSRLRKRFKYRSKSGLDLGAVVDHWASFEFAAGPVAVGHVGSALGSPQVWAATADEGKAGHTPRWWRSRH